MDAKESKENGTEEVTEKESEIRVSWWGKDS